MVAIMTNTMTIIIHRTIPMMPTSILRILRRLTITMIIILHTRITAMNRQIMLDPLLQQRHPLLFLLLTVLLLSTNLPCCKNSHLQLCFIIYSLIELQGIAMMASSSASVTVFCSESLCYLSSHECSDLLSVGHSGLCCRLRKVLVLSSVCVHVLSVVHSIPACFDHEQSLIC